MWIFVGVLLLIAWVVGFIVFKVASWAIHLLVLAALIAIGIDVFHWIRRRAHTS